MKTRQYEVIAFDLDGTLIDSKPSIVHGIKMLLRDLKLPIPTDSALRQLIGLPLPDIFEALRIDNDAYENYRGIYSTYMFEHMDQHLQAFPGVIETLYQFKAKRLRLAIVTSRGRDSLSPCLEIAKIPESLFELMIARDDTTLHKPAPEPLLLAQQKLRCPANKMLYVGDAHVDVACAVAAGCDVVFALYDADHVLKQEKSLVLAEINEFSELLGRVR